MNKRIKLSGILIAAGLSSRMGKPKALLPYQEKTFLEAILDKLLPVCDQVLVVLGCEAEQIKKTIEFKIKSDKLHFIYNPQYQSGMLTSLQAGISKVTNSPWILYHFVDQPGVPATFYSDFITALDNNYEWIQPRFRLKNGHPILINQSLFESIIQLSPNSSLREISLNPDIKKRYWDCTYPEIFQDIDDPEDYQKLIMI